MAYAYGEPLTDKSGLKEFAGRDSVDLLARVIYAEARGESWAGKQGVAYVVANRKKKNKTEFGGNTIEGVVLKPNQFVGMTTSDARQPDLTSQAWNDSLYIALNISSQDNPIGTCLWFVTNDHYAKHSQTKNGVEQYTFGSGYKNVEEKVVIGEHTFFRVAGY
mgnify:CR=1 FL=1